MAGSGIQQPNRPKKPVRQEVGSSRKPLQVMHISRKDEPESLDESKQGDQVGNSQTDSNMSNGKYLSEPELHRKSTEGSINRETTQRNLDIDNLDGISMADLLGPPDQSNSQKGTAKNSLLNPENTNKAPRSVDDFDFDENAFLAALDENEPIGNTGEIAKGAVIGVESDGVYVDIGGKAPGFMPKNECGLGVITNLKELFPKGLEVEVLVTREQNADGMVTISCRALALRKSWDTVRKFEAEGKTVEVIISGFNRGGVTCDLEGLRGFIPRSQLENGENHESLVGKKIKAAFLEVNPDTRKLVLSEKRAAIVSLFSEMEIGQLVEGKVVAIKPYGFFIDLGGISGLLHHSAVTNGSFRSLREVFNQGDLVKAMITDLDPSKGRISLNTALLEGPPGELIADKETIMKEANERSIKARKMLIETLQNKEQGGEKEQEQLN